MGFKDICKKAMKDFKEANKPDNIKKKLKAWIEIETLKQQRDEIMNKRRKEKQKSFQIGEQNFRLGRE